MVIAEILHKLRCIKHWNVAGFQPSAINSIDTPLSIISMSIQIEQMLNSEVEGFNLRTFTPSFAQFPIWRGDIKKRQHWSWPLIARVSCILKKTKLPDPEVACIHHIHTNKQTNKQTIHYHTLHCITLHSIPLDCTSFHFTLHFELHSTTLHHYNTLHDITLHCITVHYTTLHYLTVQCSTLHYITTSH